MKIVDDVFSQFAREAEAELSMSVEGNNIVIRPEDRWTYEIPLKDCETAWGAIEWLRHMSEKNWITEEMLWCLADIMARHARDSATKNSGQ